MGEPMFPTLEKAKSPEQQSYEDLKKIILEIENKSKFKQREKMPDGKEIIISPEGERFSTEQVLDPESPDVDKIVDFMGTFKPEEQDSADTIKNAIALEDYAYLVIKDADGKVIAHNETSYLELPAAAGKKKSNEVILFSGYTVADSNLRRSGLGSQLNKAAFEFGLKKAQENKQEVKALITEAVPTSEPFRNSLGYGRLYFEDKDGNIREVPYVEPPLDWNFETGEPETEAVNGHLMMRMVNGDKKVPAADLIRIVDVILEDNYQLYSDSIKEGQNPSKLALKNNRNVIKNIKKEFRSNLNQAVEGKIFFMSKEEREKKLQELQTQGKQLFETKRDDIEAGLENKD